MKKHAWAHTTPNSPKPTIARQFRRSTSHRPRRDQTAGIASTTAATPTRAVTAASADQPAASSDRAKLPEVAKVSADNNASPRPTIMKRCGMNSPR